MSKATLSDIMEHVLAFAPEAVAMSQADGNILVSLNMTLGTDYNTLEPFALEHDIIGEED